ncbi:MAG TPA: phytanoyl-CoA dioxygenase family protein [Vicinamibacteria bacterium]|jgi:hypothetical protein
MPEPRPLIVDGAAARRLQEEGACTVPFLSPPELAEARDLFARLHPGGRLPTVVRGVHMTIHSADGAYKRSVADGLHAVLAPPCGRLFRGHRTVAPFFIVKPIDEQSSVMLHQDICAVDETRHWAVKLWVPLEDASAEHGALWYLPGSHRLPGHVRGLAALWPRLHDVAEHARPWLRVCALPAGHAVVFFHRLVHGSPPNRAAGPRVAISAGIVPAEVPLRIYVQHSAESPLEVYETPDDYLYEDDAPLRENVAAAPRGGRRVEVLPSHPRPEVRWADLEPLLVRPESA